MSTDDVAELKAELANIFPLLRDSENQNAALAKTLASYAAELESVRDAFNEAVDENEKLKEQLADLSAVLGVKRYQEGGE